MKTKNENIESFLGRLLFVLFFFTVLAFSEKSSDSINDYQTVTIEQFVTLSGSATLIEPAQIPSYNIFLENCIQNFKESWENSNDLSFSNQKTNQLFKTEALKYNTFKPNLLRQQLRNMQFAARTYYKPIS